MNRPKEQRNPKQLRFLTSAVNMQGCPTDEVPEIALLGRSNAGKSSLINAMANARIAQVSSAPGKTRLLNFYQTERYRIVDMPGYGFSSRSGDEQAGWQKMIEPFLATRANLVGFLLIMDIRRDWSSDEDGLVSWIARRDLPIVAVATKADKLTRSEMLARVRAIRDQSGLEYVWPISSVKKSGLIELEDFMFASWVKSTEEKS